mgnify:CR=1 FL=1
MELLVKHLKNDKKFFCYICKKNIGKSFKNEKKTYKKLNFGQIYNFFDRNEKVEIFW